MSIERLVVSRAALARPNVGAHPVVDRYLAYAGGRPQGGLLQVSEDLHA